jgi:hypothetical protein
MEIKDLKDLFTEAALDEALEELKQKIDTEGRAGFRKEMDRDPVDDEELIRYCFSCYLFNPDSPLSHSLNILMHFLSFIIKAVKGTEEYEKLGITMYDGLRILSRTIDDSLVLAEAYKAEQDITREVTAAMNKPLGKDMN